MKTKEQWLESVGMPTGSKILSCMGFVLNIEKLIEDIQKERDSAIGKLIDDLKADGIGQAKSSKEWADAYPGCEQASYRAGAANTLTEVVEKLSSLKG